MLALEKYHATGELDQDEADEVKSALQKMKTAHYLN
jgi:hypothetical protein|tara:strand:- start:228 stop:335 length:108 start_codon:yes stop_codon:yes gene_type:complete